MTNKTSTGMPEEIWVYALHDAPTNLVLTHEQEGMTNYVRADLPAASVQAGDVREAEHREEFQCLVCKKYFAHFYQSDECFQRHRKEEKYCGCGDKKLKDGCSNILCRAVYPNGYKAKMPNSEVSDAVDRLQSFVDTQADGHILRPDDIKTLIAAAQRQVPQEVVDALKMSWQIMKVFNSHGHELSEEIIRIEKALAIITKEKT